MAGSLQDNPLTQSASSSVTTPAGGTPTLFGRAKTALARTTAKAVTRPNNPRPLTPPFVESGPDTSSWAGRALLYSFLGLVVIPSFFAAIYFAFIDTDQYVSETRLTVRAASEQKQSISDALSIFSKLGLNAGKSSVQDSYIVLDYIKSRAIVEDIGGRSYMERMFSSSNIDWLSRLPRDELTERLWKYWNEHVTATIDTTSGIVTVKVYAYSPQDAQTIATRVVDLSEKLVNSVSDRSRSDAVKQAQSEVDRSRDRLVQARAALQDFRNRNVTIDPVAKATSIGELVGKLMIDRIDTENNLATFAGTLAPNSPTARIQKDRLDVLDKQIADLRSQLTASNKGANTISSEFAEYEQLQLTEKFSEDMYRIDQLSLEKFEEEVRKQQLFLALIVRPGLAEYPLYPERSTNTILSFLGCFVIWGVLAMFAATINDHFA